MLVATCPSREELLDYAVGKLSDEAAESLAGHLDSGENCQAELAAFSDADDTLVARLRGPLPSDPFLDEPECSRAVAIARTVAENDASATGLPRLLGEYQLLERIGSGGMGTVYKALHTKLGRVVALKVLTRARTHDPAAVARFEREMQAVGQLDHRHIVRAHDAREIDGTPILVMEYLDGLDLGEIVRRAGVPALAGDRPAPAKAGTPAPGIPAPDAAELARQTAIGLQTIHEHGLVHRDIKPSNLMLSTDGEVKILDLGLARLRPDIPPGEEMTATGQGMGTADYMAPEQASDSRAVDIRADIYSLGCTLYKLLTGRAPFSGREYRTAFDKMTAHVHAAPPPVRNLAPAVPEGLATVLDRMLAKNPANRFATPAEVADALAPYCGGADLAVLLKRAASSPPLPPGDSRSRLPSGTNSGRPEKNNLPSPSASGAGDKGRRWNRFVGQLVLLLMAGGLGFALAIILRIHKDGKDMTVTVPDGSTARIGDNGEVDVTLRGTTKAAEADNLPEAQIKVFTIANGDAQKLSNMLTGAISRAGRRQQIFARAVAFRGRYADQPSDRFGHQGRPGRRGGDPLEVGRWRRAAPPGTALGHFDRAAKSRGDPALHPDHARFPGNHRQDHRREGAGRDRQREKAFAIRHRPASLLTDATSGPERILAAPDRQSTRALSLLASTGRPPGE